MSNKTIIFAGVLGSYVKARAAFEAAHELGFDVILLTEKPAPQYQRYIVQEYIFDPANRAVCLQLVNKINSLTPISGVITWSDQNVELVAELCEHLSLHGNTPDTAQKTRNKFLMKRALADMPEILPKFFAVNNMHDCQQAIATIGYPAILKPVSGSGSKGIHLVHNHRELVDAYDHLMRLTLSTKDLIFSRYQQHLILEEYLQGAEFSVEGWAYNGQITVVGVTDKRTTSDYHIEYQHIFPSSHTAEQTEYITQSAKRIVVAMGIRNSAFHLEGKVINGQFKMIEIASRPGGDYITSHLIPLATNLNFLKQCLRISVGQEPECSVEYRCHAGMRTLLAQQAGVLSSVSNLNGLMNNPSVVTFVQEQLPGSIIALPPEHYSLCKSAAVIAQHPSFQTLDTELANISEQHPLTFE